MFTLLLGQSSLAITEFTEISEHDDASGKIKSGAFKSSERRRLLRLRRSNSPRGKSKKESPRFMLYRLIGNDMPPLQSPGQLFHNLEYTLENEPEFPDCSKRWVLNNVVNSTMRDMMENLLLSNNYKSKDILIRKIDFKELQTREYPSGWEDYLTAQNEGRNAAVEDGIKSGARWILAFDGNQFITKQAWKGIQTVAARSDNEDLKYFKVPMYRLHKEQQSSWLNGDTTLASALQYAPLLGESQFAFRHDATRRYNEGVKYGNANKWQFLHDICGEKGSKRACGCASIIPEGTELWGQFSVKFNEMVGRKCGYSIRLWFYPPKGTSSAKALKMHIYRHSLRRQALHNLVLLAKEFLHREK